MKECYKCKTAYVDTHSCPIDQLTGLGYRVTIDRYDGLYPRQFVPSAILGVAVEYNEGLGQASAAYMNGEMLSKREHIFPKGVLGDTNNQKGIPEGFEVLSTGAKQSKVVERYDLMCPAAARRWSLAAALGPVKYPPTDFNWCQGIPVRSGHLNHALQHIFLYLSGNTEEDHLGHAMWRLAASIHETEGCRHHEVGAAIDKEVEDAKKRD